MRPQRAHTSRDSFRPNEDWLGVPLEGVVVDYATALGGVDVMRASFRERVSIPHAHRELEVGIVTAGSRHVVCGGRDYHALSGSILMFAPGEIHAGYPIDRTGSRYVSFLVPLSAVTRDNGDSSVCGSLRFREHVTRDHAVAEHLGAIHDAMQREPLVDRHAGELHMVIAGLLGRYATRTSTGPSYSAMRDVVCAAQQFVDVHYAERVTLDDLARIARTGVYRLIRAFRAFTGLTPHAYLEQVRIRQAAALLRSGMRASMVACHTGFSDQSHLTRHFKRVLGVPPATYQRRARARNSPHQDA